MRDLVLSLAIITALGVTLRYPFVGILLWTWFALQNPHQEAYGFTQALPLNLVIALVTAISWLLSRERKMPANGPIVWAIAAFLVWMTLNSFFAFDPAWSWPYWDRTWKIFALGLLVATMATNRVRIHALVWTMVISLFYYGVKGGIFTLITGGNYHVLGPENTIIGDNNQLAVALLMALPLANYLRTISADKFISRGILASMAITLIAIVGSYSRGALIALGALATLTWLRSGRKVLYAAVAAIGIMAALSFMPQTFWERAGTIQTSASDPDASLHGRFVAWQVAYMYANDHFPLGAGLYGPQRPAIFHHYFPSEERHAAHSIYFQVLGENGYAGLSIYLVILVLAFLKCSQIKRLSRGHAELTWAGELARAIQTSLVAFCVGGAALSMAYYDLFVICVTLLVPLGEIVRSYAPKPSVQSHDPAQILVLRAP